MSQPGKNRLQHEQSPYLLQHQNNPVDWFAWSEEAFQQAKEQNKPVFLSIGYATCHWCHVMERESFEDSDVAAFLNQYFISIKVDREERPDIDNIYMSVCQMLTGHGGWPLTIIMTPAKKPFFAGTYFPRESKRGRVGMLELLPRIHQAWQNQKEQLLKSADDLTSALSRTATKNSEIDNNLVGQAIDQLKQRYDEAYGGFGTAPKFPSPHNLLFLLSSAGGEGLAMVEKTLQAMRLGGLYDQVGFGFHRYSTDRQFKLPHFEKMLYDQAMLILAYTDAYLVTGKEFYRRVLSEVTGYVLKHMTDEQGGFYSAEDADSEGIEGKFYTWSLAELKQVLTKDELSYVENTFLLHEEGNFLEESSGEKTGTNIFYLAEENKASDFEPIRQKLFDHRQKRVHPLKDDKVLTDWNGLMIAALAGAASALGNKELLAAAGKAAAFLEGYMLTGGRLWHRYREGDCAITGMLDDYAFAAWGFISLYQANFEVRYLERAIELVEQQLQFFEDREGGFFFTASDAEDLITRSKDYYDGAIPSGNSVSLHNLLTLYKLLGENRYYERAEKLVANAMGRLAQAPSAFSHLLSGLNAMLSGGSQLVVVAASVKEAEEMLKPLRKKYLPGLAVLVKTPELSEKLAELAPFTSEMRALKNLPTAYLCQNFACRQPTTDIAELLRQLAD